MRNRGVSQTMPFIVIPRSLLREGRLHWGQRGDPASGAVLCVFLGMRWTLVAPNEVVAYDTDSITAGID